MENEVKFKRQPKPSLYTGRVFTPEPVVHKLEINPFLQPWQKKEIHDRKRNLDRAGWNDRREAREARRVAHP